MPNVTGILNLESKYLKGETTITREEMLLALSDYFQLRSLIHDSAALLEVTAKALNTDKDQDRGAKIFTYLVVELRRALSRDADENELLGIVNSAEKEWAKGEGEREGWIEKARVALASSSAVELINVIRAAASEPVHVDLD